MLWPALKYFFAFVFICLLIIAGAMATQTANIFYPSQYHVSSWSGTGIIWRDAYGEPRAISQSPAVEWELTPYRYTSPLAGARISENSPTDLSPTSNETHMLAAQDAEYEDIIARLQGYQSVSARIAAYPPYLGGFFTKQSNAQYRAPDYVQLQQYGNELGGVIFTFQVTSGFPGQAIGIFRRDKNNPESIAALRALSYNFSTMASGILSGSSPPARLQEPTSELAYSSQLLANYVSAMVDAKEDSESSSAFDAYTAAARRFATAFGVVALTLFYDGVKYSDVEPGSVFSFLPPSTY